MSKYSVTQTSWKKCKLLFYFLHYLLKSWVFGEKHCYYWWPKNIRKVFPKRYTLKMQMYLLIRFFFLPKLDYYWNDWVHFILLRLYRVVTSCMYNVFVELSLFLSLLHCLSKYIALLYYIYKNPIGKKSAYIYLHLVRIFS